MTNPDATFILPDQNKWDSSALTFTVRDEDTNFSSYSINPATILRYTNTGWSINPLPGNNDLFALIKSSDPAAFDQQDIVRYLLASPSDLSGYSDDQTVNQVFINNVINPDNGENYRVSFSDVVNLSFTEEASDGDVILSRGVSDDLNKKGLAWLPQNIGDDGDVFINKNIAALNENATFQPGTESFFVWLHEMGHAVGGLRHSTDTSKDSQKFTIMSSNEYFGTFASGLQLYDILAIQENYQNRNYNTRSGDTEYALKKGLGFSVSNADSPILESLWDGGGTDTLDVSAYNLAAQIDLRQGRFSSIGKSARDDFTFFDGESGAIGPDAGNVSIAFYSIIENATGTDVDASTPDAAGRTGDILIGNAWDNVLYGDAGNDIIHGDGLTYDENAGFHEENKLPDGNGDVHKFGPGGTPFDPNLSGDDVLIGGAGDDTLFGGRGADVLHGGLNRGDLDGARAGWDSADHFLSLNSDIMVSVDGRDAVDYSKLSGPSGGEARVTVKITDAALHNGTVEKSYQLTDVSGRFEHTEDAFFSIEKFVGTAGDSDTVDLRDLADGDFTIDDRTHITIDGQSFEFLDFEVLLLNDAANLLLNPNGPTGWTLKGAAATDTLDYSGYASAAGVTVDFQEGTVTGSGPDFFDSFENATGTGQGDVFIPGEGVDNVIDGGANGGGVDTLDYSTREVTIDQGLIFTLGANGAGTVVDDLRGTDSFTNIEAVTGSEGDDLFRVAGDAGAYTFNVMGGDDLLDYRAAGGPLTIDLSDAATGTGAVVRNGGSVVDILALTEPFSGVNFALNADQANNLVLGAGSDSVDFRESSVSVFAGGNLPSSYGFEAGDLTQVNMGAGDDILTLGLGASDVVFDAGAGDDLIRRGSVFDGNFDPVVSGGAGIDTIAYELRDNLLIDATTLTVTNLVTGEVDTNFTGVEIVRGGRLSVGDIIIGDDTAVLDGGRGDDTYVYTGGNLTIQEIDNFGTDTLDLQGFGGAAVSKASLKISIPFDNSVIILTNLIFDSEGAVVGEDLIGTITHNGVIDEINIGAILSTNLSVADGEDSVTGTQYSENIFGGDLDDTLEGLNGNDILFGGAGFDILRGGVGDDELHAEDDGGEMFGGSGQDALFISDLTAEYVVNGGSGFDKVVFESGGGPSSFEFVQQRIGASVSALVRHNGNDLLTIGSTIEMVEFSTGEQVAVRDLPYVFDVTAGNDRIPGSDQADVISGGAGNDSLFGEGGDDTLNGGSGSDFLEGSSGDDVLTGGTEGDLLIGDSGDDQLFGGDGDDFIDGGSGSDMLFGGDGNDFLEGGFGATGEDDVLDGGAGDDEMFSGSGNDTYIVSTGHDTILDAGGASDVLVFGASITLQSLQLAGAFYRNVDNGLVVELSADDSITIDSHFEGRENFFGEVGQVASMDFFRFDGGSETDLFTLAYETRGTEDADIIDGITFAGLPNDTIFGNGGDDTITVGEGTDIAFGGADNDTLIGDSGNNQLFGDAGDDILEAVGGINTLEGGIDDDTFIYSGGVATITDVSGTDTLRMGNAVTLYHIDFTAVGNDMVIDTSTIDAATTITIVDQFSATPTIENMSFVQDDLELSFENFETSWVLGDFLSNIILGDQFAGDLNDTLLGYEGDDQLSGGGGNDILWGALGEDVLDGGAGDDVLVGGLGDDTYIASDGADVFRDQDQFVDPNLPQSESQGSDTIIMWNSITLADIDMFRDINDALHIVDLTSSREIIVEKQFNTNDAAFSMETLQFFDGSALDVIARDYRTEGTGGDDLILGIVSGGGQNDTVLGLDADDVLMGGDGNDTLNGGVGNDILEGGLGDDTYIFNGGLDTIRDIGGFDTLTFDPGTSIADVRIERAGLDAKIILNGNSDELTVENQVFGANPVEILQFDVGPILDFTGISNWVLGGNFAQTINGTEFSNDIIIGNGGSNTLSGLSGNDILVGNTMDDVLIGGDGDDDLVGGDGDDTLDGGAGNDTYHYAAFSGADTILENGGNDTIQFGPDIILDDLSYFRDGNDLTIFTDNTSSNTLTIISQFGGTVENMAFFDASSFILNAAINIFATNTTGDTVSGTTGSDTLLGGLGDDVLDGNSGDDTLFGGQGNDTLSGGTGSDQLFGGAGNDEYVYEQGTGAIIIEDTSGSDVIKLGAGVFRSNMNFDRNGNDLIISTDNTGANTITLIDHFADNAEIIETLVFDDGETIDLATIVPGPGVNTDPIAQDDVISGAEDVVVTGNVLDDNGSGVDSDPDLDIIEVVPDNFVLASGATVDLQADGTLIYTPALNFNGVETFEYTLNDSQGGSDTAMVTVNVLPVNDAPVAQDDSFAGDQDLPISGNVLLDNGSGVDSDIDGDVLTVQAGVIATAAGGQAILLDGSGNFIYIPLAGFSGADSFDYTLLDGNGGSDIGTVNLTVNPVVVNNDPIARDDTFTVAEDGALAENVLVDNGNGEDSDVDGDSLAVVPADIVTANGGSVMLLASGEFFYSPAADFNGPDSFNYTVLDGNGGQDVGLVNIDVTPVNDAPVAADDFFQSDEDVMLSGNVLVDNSSGADSDVDGDALTVVDGTFTTVQGGSVVLSSDGSFDYTPAANFNGADSFEYTVEDGNGGSDMAIANITVNPVNDAPDAIDDIFSGVQGQEIEGNLLVDNDNGADFDLDGDTLQVVSDIITSAQGGSVIIMGNGDFTYMPPANFSGADSFEYTVIDGQGGSDIATVDLTLTPAPNQDPVAQDDSFSTILDQSVTGNVLDDNGMGADFDPDGDAFSVQSDILVTANGGMVSINADGSFSYTPASGFSGPDSFDYMLLDSRGGTGTGTVNLTIVGSDIIGTEGRDRIRGTNDDDMILGLGGNDKINGKSGDDFIDGGAGNDKIDGDRGNDTILGGDGNDRLDGDKGDDILEGGAGEDKLKGGRGDDTLSGGDDSDWVFGGRGDDTLNGDAGNDDLNGGHGDDVLNGGAGDDELEGGRGNDILIGDDGTAADESETTHSFTKTNPRGSDRGGDIKNIETSFNETTNQFSFELVVSDPHGKDTNGFTLVINDGPNPKGNPGEMAIMYFDASGGEPVVSVYGYNGLNNFSSFKDGAPDAGIQTPDQIMSSLETGNPFTDITATTDAHGNNVFSFTLDATAITEHMPLHGTEEAWNGLSFADKLGMWLHPQTNLDTEYGEDGFLTQWDYASQGWFDSVNSRTETTTTGSNNDELSGGKGDDQLFGGVGDDELEGGKGDDLLDGGTGDDELEGGRGDDQLFGGDGNDELEGDKGDDLLYGGAGDDSLEGGKGADTFKFQSADEGLDVIDDFSARQGDKIDIEDVLSVNFDPVQDMLSHFVEIDDDGHDAVLKVDADGQGTASEMTAIAIIEGGAGLDVQELLDNGGFII